MAKKIKTLPIAPSSDRPATFNAEADAFVAALAGFVSDANALAKEAEELSQNATDKSGNVDEKHEDLVTKYNDFIAKYQDFFAKFDLFIPKYDDTVRKHGEVLTHSAHVDSQKQLIDEALERAKSFINEGNGGIIDDTKISETSTYSSKKIQTELNKKMEQTDVYTRSQADDTFVNKNTSNWLATTIFQKSDNGYLKLSNGFIIQWLKKSFINNSHSFRLPFTFPVAFPNACLGGSVSANVKTTGGAEHNNGAYPSSSFGGIDGLTNSGGIAKIGAYNQILDTQTSHIYIISFGY